MIIARVKHVEWLLAVAALLIGLAAWAFYLREGLVLAHYDAKAHLVVARRVIDSLTPGWKQIGAVWLPLPHLIQIVPTQIDLLYRTGAFGSVVSVLSFGVSAWAMARLVLLVTRSRAGALTSCVLFVVNPSLLYVQATPMTEPLLLAATLVSVLRICEWLTSSVRLKPHTTTSLDRVPASLGWILFLTAWTRYEAWPILAASLAAVAFALARREGITAAVRRTLRLASWPAVAVAIFLVVSRVTVGTWFVSGGFYEHDPTYDRQAIKSLLAVWWGTHRLSGYLVEIVALACTAYVVWRAIRLRDEAPRLVTVALFAAAALPFLAFYEAHPFRIRYMLPIVTACTLFCGFAVGLLGPPDGGSHRRRASWILAAILAASTVIESPPWRTDGPLLIEAQLDAANGRDRRRVTSCLAPAYRGEKVMASMGSLAHYMQELSADGFAIADFIHEGNGAIWNLAIETGPAVHAGWMLVEEQSEGGDVLAQRARADASFTRGMTKVCEGGGVSLYRRE